MSDQKTMRISCLSVFSIIWLPKLLLTTIKNTIFGPKMAKFCPKFAFLVILGQILAFFAHFVREQLDQGGLVGFPLFGYENF